MRPMPESETRDLPLVAIGGSAGGIEAVGRILETLPVDFPAALLVVIHLAPRATSNLPAILSRQCELPVRHPFNGEAIAPGVVYVAPPDRHMIVRDGHIGLTLGPRENRVRPSVDVLFRSVANSGHPNVTGVVLSGGLDDGASGLATLAAAGGRTIVQDPEEAVSRGMPANAIERVLVQYVVPVTEIGPLIQRLVRDEPAPVSHPSTGTNHSSAYGITCPECHGILHESEEHGVPVYTCRVGHAFSTDSLLEAQSSGAEAALWIAVRALEERADFCQRLAQRFHDKGFERSAERMATEAHEIALQAEVVRHLLKGEYTGGDPHLPVAHE